MVLFEGFDARTARYRGVAKTLLDSYPVRLRAPAVMDLICLSRTLLWRRLRAGYFRRRSD